MLLTLPFHKILKFALDYVFTMFVIIFGTGQNRTKKNFLKIKKICTDGYRLGQVRVQSADRDGTGTAPGCTVSYSDKSIYELLGFWAKIR